MAQTGYTPILIYSSSTASNAPAVGNLTNSTLGSELAINITDGKLFYKDNANAIQVIGWKTTPATAGGTGQTSYAVGDILYANTTTTLAKLADVATGNALISGGVGVAPSYGKIGLTTHVSGTLPIANGGTNQTSFTSPASSIAGLTYFDGTSLVNNGTPSRLGFNATSNTFYATTIVSGSADAKFAGIDGYTPQIQTRAGDTNSSGFGVFAFTSGGVGRYQVNRSKSTTIGTNTALVSGDVVGVLQYGAADGTGYINCADIRAFVDGAVSTNVVPGRLGFFTNNGGSTNPVEQVRIDSSANMTVLNGNLIFSAAAKGITGSSSFSVTIANGAAGNLVDLSTALPAGASGLVIVNGASAGKTTILAQRDSGGYYSVTELGTQPRGTYITSITLSGTNLRITNSSGASETFTGKVVVLTN